jgi:hypothetical protein
VDKLQISSLVAHTAAIETQRTEGQRIVIVFCPSSYPLPSIDVKVFLEHISIRMLDGPKIVLTSLKPITTTVRSANFLPASAAVAFCADSATSNLMKILPTPGEDLAPLGRGILSSRILPNFSHSSRTSALISGTG